ncbi:hypothetical protein Tco_1210269 [Tanacetum coccineum]
MWLISVRSVTRVDGKIVNTSERRNKNVHKKAMVLLFRSSRLTTVLYKLEKKLGIPIVACGSGPRQNGTCSKPQARIAFTPEDRKKFCQFIKGLNTDGWFGSNFKHKVTDNDTNITGLKSHDCHIIMQRLLPYGLQQYLPPDVAKPLIELCLFFKQICSQTLMVDDMLKAQSKVIDILCNLELIYPPAFFDIMIHLVIYLPLEAIFGGPIHPWWMYPFKRYMKKLKNYVRNKAKPEGSIAEGYVAEEALTFSSHYFRDVTMKFNHLDCNVDCPPPTPEIDAYRAKFNSEFPNKDMKGEFLGWFGKQIRQRHVDNDLGVSESNELFALACGPSQTPISVNSCVVNGVRSSADCTHWVIELVRAPESPIWVAGERAGCIPQLTWNLRVVKEPSQDMSGPVQIQCELNDEGDPHAAVTCRLIGAIPWGARFGVSLAILSWRQMRESGKAGGHGQRIQFDCCPHMEIELVTNPIFAGNQSKHLQNIYNGKKVYSQRKIFGFLKEDGTYDLEA